MSGSLPEPTQGDTNDLHLPQPSSSEGGSAVADDKVEDKIQDKDHDWEHDPANPMNWSPIKKWITTILVSLYTFVTPLASSIMAPGLPYVAVKYDIANPTVLSLTLSIFLLSFAIGPLFAGPLSEVYGRQWVLHIGNLFFLVFNLGCALSPNTVTLLVFRFLAGFAAAPPIACGPGVVSDLFAKHERASALALFSVGPLIGPAVGPAIGGFIAESAGVEYVFYVIVAISAVAAILGIFLVRETYAPIIRLRLDNLVSDPEKPATRYPALPHGMGKWAYLWLNLKRPVILLTRSLICFMLSLYMALSSIYYLMFATFPDLFSNVYHFSIGIGGLAYIGLGLGFVASSVFGARFSDKMYKYLTAKNGGKGNPEMRVPGLVFGSFFVPVGLFWYGWSAQAELHYMMPITGTAIFGFGIMLNFLHIQLYLVDAFTFAASAIAASSTFRSFLGFAFPLFGEQMYAALGYGGGNSLLAGLSILIGIPFPIWIYYAGERLRANNSLTRR
ncbi:major facilitator superfamily domain-containing protein [Suillus clintonianus]|uniref:major facilitator superfamily domain-containing protein n=1 Tax=Suillus clintonianus TaxID=1904413 RepID=UPI001B85BC65|nr:major facilitator superfamily domain-containing protein [Suillus clintonianus]KAG2146699.1 major facilitator superfamily domain-containing protein [Suillus clintonianus]